jgi:hypothetical protein
LLGEFEPLDGMLDVLLDAKGWNPVTRSCFGATRVMKLRMTAQQYPGMPKWVKVGALIAGAIFVLALIAILASNGEHGPWRHMAG